MAFRAFSSIFSMFCFAPLQNRFGTVKTYQMAMMFWPLTISFYPILNLAARCGASDFVMNGILCIFFIVWGTASIAWRESLTMFCYATKRY